ncbi:MAG TPA: hypothetical protein VHI71_11865 [Actinomycetota bacterium]|nr:hypothetical protein [Actinomycetota bacterium]
MRKLRLLIACFIAACSVVPLAPPAAAQSDGCDDWPSIYVWIVPPFWEEQYVEDENGTLTIRGDLAAGRAAWLADYYESNATRFVDCTLQVVSSVTSPITTCLAAATEPILSSPDPVGRYVEAETNLVVKVHYERAFSDAVATANCNGIVRYGD